MKVLVTGGCGILGTALVALDHELIFYDRAEPHPLLEGFPFERGSIGDTEKLRSVMDGCDAVVHCAGYAGEKGQLDFDVSAIHRDNILGCQIVFDLAAELGVRTVVFASSNHAVGMFELEARPEIYSVSSSVVVDHDSPARPDSLYGASKVFAESYGRYLAEKGGPRFVSLRVGSVRKAEEDHPYAYAEWGVRKGLWTRDSREYAEQECRLKSIWLSRRDFVQLVDLALKYEGGPYDQFYGVSRNDRSWLDIAHAEQALGYLPQDHAEGSIEVIHGTVSVPAVDTRATAIIPVRVDGRACVQSIADLLKMALKSAREADRIEAVFVTTNCGELVALAESFGADGAFVRPLELSGPDVRADLVLQAALPVIEQRFPVGEYVVPMEVTYPFRPEGLIDGLINVIGACGYDSVIAGGAETRPAWQSRNGVYTRIDEYAKLRVQREPLYIGLPSLGCVTRTECIRRGSRLGSRIGLVQVEDLLARLEIRDGAELKRFRDAQV